MNHVLQQPGLPSTRTPHHYPELGFDRFPKAPMRSALSTRQWEALCRPIHPVPRHFSNGKMVNEFHLQSGVFVRYDAPNEKFAVEFDKQRPRNLVFNLINGIADVTDETLTTNTFTGGEIGGFTPWPPERHYEGADLPQCIRTHQPDFVPDLARYQ
jgi:hypothetical protein